MDKDSAYQLDYNKLYGEDQILPDLDNDFVIAKTFFQKASTQTGDNLYDHLTEVLNRIITEKPDNIVDFFEEFSKKIKDERFKPCTDHLQEIYIAPEQFTMAMTLKPLLKVPSIQNMDEEEQDNNIEEESSDSTEYEYNLQEVMFYFEKCGIGFPSEKVFLLTLLLRNLQKSNPIHNLRFWGIIYGLQRNYYIAEAEWTVEELAKKQQEFDDEEEARAEERARQQEADEEAAARLAAEEETRRNEAEEEGGTQQEEVKKVPRPLPPIPKANFKPELEVPPEKFGQGLNKKIYFACNGTGDPWIQLPDVTPQILCTSRQIVKYFTGNLDHSIETYPLFTGLERHYLRAQLARISGSTQISPSGFYQLGEGEEEEAADDEEGVIAECSRNKSYEPPPIGDLADPSMTFWVHHTQYILNQGRTVWWNPKSKGEGEEEAEEEADDEEIDEMNIEPEVGPSLLTPLSEDQNLNDDIPVWTVRKCSKLFGEQCPILVRSNVWPGAYAFAFGKRCENIYIGYGHKIFVHNYSPMPLPQIQKEYLIGPEVLEIMDPTVMQEEEWRIAHLPIPEEMEEEEEIEEEDDV